MPPRVLRFLVTSSPLLSYLLFCTSSSCHHHYYISTLAKLPLLPCILRVIGALHLRAVYALHLLGLCPSSRLLISYGLPHFFARNMGDIFMGDTSSSVVLIKHHLMSPRFILNQTKLTILPGMVLWRLLNGQIIMQ